MTARDPTRPALTPAADRGRSYRDNRRGAIIGAGIRDPRGHTHLTWSVCRPPVTEYALSRGAASLRSIAVRHTGDCHPAYEPCLPNLAGDALNCGDLTSAQRPVRVKKIGVDPYRLDRDQDGNGCE